jgi:putative phage-type endonuclease
MFGIEDTKLQQGSQEWHEFRSRHVGASEVPAIMGTCDFKNMFTLWMEKTGIHKKEVSTFATERGKSWEQTILALYTDKTGNATSSEVMEYPEWPVLSASLDGFVNDKKIVVEVKYPSKAKHEFALCGKVPETYRDQLQTQMLVTGSKIAHYVSFNEDMPENMKLAIVEVPADKERQALILQKAKEFWALVESKTYPEGSAEQPELAQTIARLMAAKEKAKLLEASIKEMEDSIKSQMKANTVLCDGFKIAWSERKGSVDYAKIPELKGIDVEPYRKAPSRIFSIKPLA